MIATTCRCMSGRGCTASGRRYASAPSGIRRGATTNWFASLTPAPATCYRTCRRHEMNDHPYPRERTWSDCEAEIERLKYNSHYDLARIENQAAEIERLRDQVTRLSTLVDTERGLHKEAVEKARSVAAT